MLYTVRQRPFNNWNNLNHQTTPYEQAFWQEWEGKIPFNKKKPLLGWAELINKLWLDF